MTYVVFIFVLCLYVKLKMDMMSKSAWGDVDQPAPIVPKFRREKKNSVPHTSSSLKSDASLLSIPLDSKEESKEPLNYSLRVKPDDRTALTKTSTWVILWHPNSPSQ